MTIQDFGFPREWYEDEVREGFFVPTTMKRNWAGQLEILREIAEVCDKLGLTWYLDGGTLLGAVRHQGFVPWDDDMDIMMFRRDIEIFRKKAYSLLPKGYLIMDPRDADDVNVDVFRVVNSQQLDATEEYLKKYHCPFLMGIDIFPLDNYSEDEAYESNRQKLMMALKMCVSHLKDDGDLENPDFKTIMAYCEEETGVDILNQKNPIHTLYQEMMKLYAELDDDTTKKVKLFFGTQRLIYDREWFGTPKMLPFEGIDLPVPCEYEKVLFVEYGNQKYINRGSAAHDYPYYTKQEEAFRDEVGHYIFRYTYNPEDLLKPKAETPREMTSKILSVLNKLQNMLTQVAGDVQARNQILMNEQKMLSTLTGIVLPRFANGEETLSETLRVFSEEIFNVFSEWQPDSADRLGVKLATVDEEIRRVLQNRKIIVFLPCRTEWWKSMEELWRYAKGLSNATVYVAPIAWYEQPEVCERGERHDETDDFPQELQVIPRTELDLKTLHPEAIVIHVPYDNMGSFMMIDDENCSYQLRNVTDKLIYVPCFLPNTPGLEEGVGVRALENLIEQPAVMFADEVHVPTSRMREIYIDTLTELGGEDKRPYWEAKIKADDCMEITMRDTVFGRS